MRFKYSFKKHMLFWDNAMQKSRFRQKKLDLTLMGDLNKLTQLKDFQLNGSDNVLVNYKCLLVNPSVLGNFSYNKTKTRWKCSKKNSIILASRNTFEWKDRLSSVPNRKNWNIVIFLKNKRTFFLVNQKKHKCTILIKCYE